MFEVKYRLRWAAYDARCRFKRVARAWRYASGKMSEDDAQSITIDCQDAAGWYPIAMLTTESVLESAIERYGDIPEMPELAARACSRVHSKWGGVPDDYVGAAEDWAFPNLSLHTPRTAASSCMIPGGRILPRTKGRKPMSDRVQMCGMAPFTRLSDRALTLDDLNVRLTVTASFSVTLGLYDGPITHEMVIGAVQNILDTGGIGQFVDSVRMDAIEDDDGNAVIQVKETADAS